MADGGGIQVNAVTVADIDVWPLGGTNVGDSAACVIPLADADTVSVSLAIVGGTSATMSLTQFLGRPAADGRLRAVIAGGRGEPDAAPERTTSEGISAERAIAWLAELAATWQAADVPAAKAELLHAIYERIVVTGRTIVSIRLTPSAYAHGLALALPDKVARARPTGVGRALAAYDLPIEGRDEWLAAARRLA